MSNPGDKVEAKYKAILNDLADGLNYALNTNPSDPRTGFCLFLFDFGDRGYVNYISNANRRDMVAAVRAWLERAESELKDD